jgi:putative glutathione S-transferase
VLELAGGAVPIPQGALVSVARKVYNGMWRLMVTELAPQDEAGAYVRPPASFTGCIGSVQQSGDVKFPAEPGRYHLYLGQACPWCHRVALALALSTRSGDFFTSSYCADDPEKASRGGWAFTQERPDPVFGQKDLAGVYQLLSPGYVGRCTAPLLVDAKSRCVVSNDSLSIVRMIFELGGIDIRPAQMRAELDALSSLIYEDINNGVYKCGFSTSQQSYSGASASLFAALQAVDCRLETRRFLGGDVFTEPDLLLLPTILRFDCVYAILFKCTRQPLSHFRNLVRWRRDCYALPGVASTFNLAEASESYFTSLFPLNPSGIVPEVPTLEEMGLLISEGGNGEERGAVLARL